MRRHLSLLIALLALTACAKQANLTLGQPTDGALAASDPASAEGPYEDRYTFDATANQRLRIEMTSDSVDAFLRLLGPDGAAITTNDDALGRDAAITFKAPAAGRYTVVATSFGTEKTTGAYRVALSELTATYANPGVVERIDVGQSPEGVLELGDRQPDNGAFQDTWEFRPAAAGAFLMDLTSSQFDPKLVVQDSAGVEIISDDDSGEGTNAQLTLTAEAGKLYKLVVTSFGSAAKSGVYRLAVAAAPAVDR